ncbi:MAG: hypothetical protein KDA68_20725, partial [Planctomycetaceae bacterium]|nr:hypothetical protein [Planctomycetaceae bacterium]
TTTDGKEVPQKSRLNILLYKRNYSGSYGGKLTSLENGRSTLKFDETFSGDHADFDELSAWMTAPGYPPQPIAGPFKRQSGPTDFQFDFVIEPGFSSKIQLRDPDGKPITKATVTASCERYFYNSTRKWSSDFKSGKTEQVSISCEVTGPDESGTITLPAAASLKTVCNVIAPGFQEATFTVEPSPEKTYVQTLKPTHPVTLLVLDRLSRTPVSDATAHLVERRRQLQKKSSLPFGLNRLGISPNEKQENEVKDLKDPRRNNGGEELVSSSDAQGRMLIDSLRQNWEYSFYIRAPDGRHAVIRGVRAVEQKPVEVLLETPLKVSGRFQGNLGSLQSSYDTEKADYVPGFSWVNPLMPDQDFFFSFYNDLKVEKGRGYFEIDNLLPGKLDINYTTDEGFTHKSIDLTNSMEDLVIDLPGRSPNLASNSLPTRTVHVHLTGLPDNEQIKGTALYHHALQPNNKKIDLTSRDFTLEAPVDRYLSLDSVDIPGYWSSRIHHKVEPGDFPLNLDWPLHPAGGLTGTFSTPLLPDDPPPSLSIYTLVRPPGFTDSINLPEPRFGENHEFACAPLPLGGVYRFIANDRRPGSAAIALFDFAITREMPFPKADLKFLPGREITARVLDPDGKPVPNFRVALKYSNEYEIYNTGSEKPSHHGSSEKPFSVYT